MNLQQLRFVRETAQHGFSLTRAAQAIGTSQPALSRGILELEAELGVDVFVRHGKRILGLTEPGKAVLARAERVLAEVAGIEQVTADFRARDTGELRVATTHTQARYTLPETAEDDYSEWQDTQGNTSVPWEQVLAESELAFTGRDLQDNAAVSPDNTTSNWVVHFELKNERKKDFLNFTRRNVGRLMAIVLDDECQMAPSIKSEIPGKGIIEGNFDPKEASDLKLL